MVSKPWHLQVLLMTPGIIIIVIAIWMLNSGKNNKGNRKVENINAIISTILFVIGGLPLLIYPVVLIVNAMSLAGERTGHEGILLIVLALLFMAASTSYPLTYIVSLIYYKKNRKILISLAPIIHVVITILIGLLCLAIEKGLHHAGTIR